MATWRELYPLEAIKPLKKTIGSLFIYAIVLLFLYIFSLSWSGSSTSSSGIAGIFNWISPLWFIVIFFIITILTYIYQVFYMKYYFYDMQGKSLVIAKGVFSRNEITLPINRIQDVYVDQDILDRIFGLYDVHVSSATTASGALSHIDGVNKGNSEKLKGLLLQAIHQ
ncbi:MAG: PH domain-containing protein [Candidatus Pacearchaeota archaeon]